MGSFSSSLTAAAERTGLLLKNVLFTVLVPGTVAVYIPLLLTRGQSPASGLTSVPGLVLVAFGAGMYAWCVWDFATFGRGTPLPLDAPKRLVIRGLYRYTRNPMYVSVLTVLAGWVILFRSPVLIFYMLGAALVVHLFVIYYEEPTLRELFGQEYDAYCQRVGRWLPRFKHWPAA